MSGIGVYDFDWPASRLVVRLQWECGQWHVVMRDTKAMSERLEWNRWAPGQHIEYTIMPLDEFLAKAERDFGLRRPTTPEQTEAIAKILSN